MEGRNLLEFRNKFHKFRISIKNPLNFYRFNLVLARLKLTGKSSTRYIFLIFLESRTGYDLPNKICLIIFRGQMNPMQIFKVCNNLK
jgi:hypothetical protein